MYVSIVMFYLGNNDTTTTSPHHPQTHVHSLYMLNIGTICFSNISIWWLIKSMYVKSVNTGASNNEQYTLKLYRELEEWLSS